MIKSWIMALLQGTNKGQYSACCHGEACERKSDSVTVYLLVLQLLSASDIYLLSCVFTGVAGHWEKEGRNLPASHFFSPCAQQELRVTWFLSSAALHEVGSCSECCCAVGSLYSTSFTIPIHWGTNCFWPFIRIQAEEGGNKETSLFFVLLHRYQLQ